MPWIYIVRCSDDFYYTGSTWDLPKRIDQHNAGAGSMFTRRRLPVELVFAQEFERIDDAWAAERRVHGWSRAKKEALISGRFDLLSGLSRNGRQRSLAVGDLGQASVAETLSEPPPEPPPEPPKEPAPPPLPEPP